MTYLEKLSQETIPFLEFLSELRTPFLDTLISYITHLGDEVVFLAIAIIFFWCIDKRRGYFILITGLMGTLLNQFLKIFFRVPRPEVLSPGLEIVESARERALGYSFPSGHTQSAASCFGAIAASAKKKWVSTVCVILILLVGFSRMYLGVHTPIDIIGSLLLALLLVLILRPVFVNEENFRRFMPLVVILSNAVAIGFLIYTISISSDSTLDPHNFESAMKNAYTMLGCTVGLIFVYIFDSKINNFDTKAPWYGQLLKLVLGLAVVLLIKSGLSAPLVALFGNEFIARAVRYFLIVFFAGCIWPLTFGFFSRLGKRAR